jgi:hypothetical protein
MSAVAIVFQTSSSVDGGWFTGVGFGAFASLPLRLASSSSCLLGAWLLDDDDLLRFLRERDAQLP